MADKTGTPSKHGFMFREKNFRNDFNAIDTKRRSLVKAIEKILAGGGIDQTRHHYRMVGNFRELASGMPRGSNSRSWAVRAVRLCAAAGAVAAMAICSKPDRGRTDRVLGRISFLDADLEYVAG
ncbi:hypothetical protein [Agrobacterium sp. NPDC090283]|uniref:hypothetical protein n=1 Tax=Agrobacterium sp. NPDC090283 TaxID=3363920 RepID=UPI00383A79A6